MNIKNKISEFIRQQFHTEGYDFLVRTMHNIAADQISDSIASCIMDGINCHNIRCFYITTREVEEGNLESIKDKIQRASTREDGKFNELLSKFHQSLEEYSKLSLFELFSMSAEQMLKDFLNIFCPSYKFTTDINKNEEGGFSDLELYSGVNSHEHDLL
jgi:hypothetical protein